jgi:predicted metal-dependent hydrolase
MIAMPTPGLVAGATKEKFYRESDMRAMKETEQFLAGVGLFNAESFFEAHEVWEELWLVELEPEKTFLQGLIQLAAACHHHGRGNARCARSLAAAGLAKLARFPDDHRGIALGELRLEAALWLGARAGDDDLGSRKLPRIRVVGQAGRTRKTVR